MDLELEVQLRQAEARKQELERAHQEALHALAGCPSEALEARQSRVRELDKKIALETVRCEELQLELSARARTPNHHHAAMSNAAPKGSEIERIMAKIEQDNRILAELEHTRSTTLGTGLATSASSHALGESSPPISPITMSHTTPAICYPTSSLSGGIPTCQPSSFQYLPPNSAYSTISNQYNTYPQYPKSNPTGSGAGNILSGLSNLTNMSNISNLGPSSLGVVPTCLGQTNLNLNPSSIIPNYSSLVSTNPTSSIPSYNSAPYSTNSLNPSSYSLPYNPTTTYTNNVTFTNPLSAQFSNTLPLSGPVGMNIKLKPLDETDLGAGRRVATPCTPHPPSWGLSTSLGMDTRPMSRMLPDGLDTEWALHSTDRGTYLNGHSTEGQVDMLDIPGKGRCSVYIARFSYEPDPETSEEELAVSAGDYLLVWSDLTSSNPNTTSYLDAELLDGRRGLVPAHFCTRLVGDDLLEFHQAVLSTLREEEPLGMSFGGLGTGFSSGGDSYVQDLQRIAEMAEMSEGCDEESSEVDTAELLFSVLVPAPRQLTLERQLNKSVLIGWTAPDTGPGTGNQIESYHVYVDGVLKTTVKATERTRALVEGVDSNRPHRISVRSVTANRRTSRDAACTMVIGKDTHMLGPTAVRASHVTSSQAVISWLPANSNHQHVVCVNNVEVRTVKPGVYRHTITGLAPNTQYRVTVRAKHLRAQPTISGEEPPSPAAAHTDFRTLPKGLPDPPSDILVEPGPQDGTLLVTWHPVLAMHHPGSFVTGYAVYADGKKVTDVDSPTGDHALIDISKLLGLNPKHVTVRTKSRDSQSADSAPTPIPNSVLRGGARIRQPHTALPMHVRSNQGRMVGQQQQQVIEHDENLSDKEIFPSGGGRVGGVPQIGTYQEAQSAQARSNLRPVPEITKDTASEANMSEDDYLDSRRRQQQHYQASPRAKQPQPQPQHYQQSGNIGGTRGRGQGGARGGQPPAAQKRARWFVALFDYDPATMSPNPDACEEELPFSEGDTIKVWGDKDADGFYWGECRGRRGFVPHNMVMEVEGREANRDRWGDIYANMPVKRMIALYDYDPQELSPNVDAEVELSFTTGSIIHVYGDMDDDGFYMGELDGVRGLVPSNFLTEAPDQYSAGGSGVGSSQAGVGGGAGVGRGARSARGHGPGARGPPPPPRDGRAARGKSDACPVVPCSQLDTLNSHSTTVPMLPNTQPHASDHHQVSQSQGRGRGVTQMQQNVPRGRGGNNEFSMQQQQSGVGGMQRPQHRGVPAVIPTSNILPPQQMQQQQQQQQQQNTGPNLMQKFTEMTAPGGDILSKGKELIFMKFGLGGGK